MKKYIYIIGIALLTVGVLPSFSQVSNDNEDEVNKIDTRWAKNDFVPGQVLVKFKDANRVQVNASRGQFRSTSIDRVTQVLQKYGTDGMEQLLPNENPNRKMRRAKAYNGDVIQERDLSQLYLVKLSADHLHETMQMVDELTAIDEVEIAEPNYRVYMMADTHIADDYSDNPLENQQWGLDNYGVKELWNKPVINKDRPVIAILDTGVDINHPDLKNNVWTNTLEAYGTADNDNDGNGFKNDVHGWDFVNNTANIRDNNMHGTHVAGIAAAANNSIGIIGANPQALIMPITVLQSDGSGDVATIIKGIDYAVTNGATVLNMSLGTYINSKAMRQTLGNAYQKAVLVAAAGNDGRCIYFSHWFNKHFPPEPQPAPCFPAAYSFVLGVQASDRENYVTEWSNYDDDGPIYSCETTFFDPDGYNYELKAPGRKILSTIPGGGYKTLNGTSMAAPLVAGAISALKMVKQYDTQEILWGDLLHTKNIAETFLLTNRPAELDLLKVELRERKDLSELTEEDYSGDNEVDAGETIHIYPVLKTTFGEATNIKLKLVVEEFEDPSAVEILVPQTNFGNHIDAFGKAVSLNPLVIRIPNNIADARHISMKIVVTCNENSEPSEFPFVLLVHNMIKISGLINDDRILTADHTYYVNGTLAVNDGASLTIEPGTRLEFAAGVNLNAFGKLNAKGTPEKPIVFCHHTGDGIWDGIYAHGDEGGNYHNGDILYTNADTTLFTLLPTDITPNTLRNYNFEKRLYYNEDEIIKRDFRLKYYLEDSDPDSENMTGREQLLTDPNFITPAMLKMKRDIDDYCGSYATQWTEGMNNSHQISVSFLNWVTYDNPRDTMAFCKIEGCSYQNSLGSPVMQDCVLEDVTYPSSIEGDRCVVTGAGYLVFNSYQKHFNYIGNIMGMASFGYDCRYSEMYESNFFNNSMMSDGKSYSLSIMTNKPTIDHAKHPSYMGSGREDIVRSHLYEMGNAPNTWGIFDLSNMPPKPFAQAHGIVWKVLVDGKDAQDEFELLAPLGVGKHKFEVYFNRPMNKTVLPQMAFGLRDPYTQNAIGEDGRWNEDGTIYTAYVSLSGKTNSDGLNRIKVWGAEDNEYVICPTEDTRFNVIIQVAGSMSTGFSAQPGLGCVRLTWNNENNDFEDAMGFNVYRYREYQKTIPAGWRDGSWHDEETFLASDTIRVNGDIIDIESVVFTDYNVTPGETYYYYYKVLSTDLQEYDVSNVVAVTPLTAIRGDANGSSDVDVADVITTVNYITKQEPKPFIFEAADMNEDNIIDVLDVVDIIRGILNPSLLATTSVNEESAIYTIENGVLYVESPVAMAGVQAQLSLDGRCQMEDVRVAADLEGFEQASAWLTENDYLFMAYSMRGKTLAPGKHALLYIGDADLSNLRLSDTQGHNVTVVAGEGTTKVDAMGSKVMTAKGIYNLNGQKLNSDKLRKGIYIINGIKVVK